MVEQQEKELTEMYEEQAERVEEITEEGSLMGESTAKKREEASEWGGNNITTDPDEDESYDDTRDEADSIEGSSLLHEIYNAIVAQVAKTKVTGYTVEYVLGTNFTESGGAGDSWVPWNSAPIKATHAKDFSLKKWSYADAVREKEATGFDLKSYRRYISAFQMDYTTWTSSQGTPSKSWGAGTWKAFVNAAPAKLDGSGDGKADPHNYYDALVVNGKYGKEKGGIANQWKLKSDEYKDDMLTIGIASHYVGILGRGSVSFIKDESKNPYIQLCRIAVKEAHTGGKHYTAFKKAMEGQTHKTTHSEKTKGAINQLYKDNGWSGSGSSSFTKNGLRISGPGSSTQDIHYGFLVYWGGMVARENIEKQLKSAGE